MECRLSIEIENGIYKHNNKVKTMDVSKEKIETVRYNIVCNKSELDSIRTALRYIDQTLFCNHSVYSDILNNLKDSNVVLIE